MLLVEDSLIDVVKNVFNLILKYFVDEISKGYRVRVGIKNLNIIKGPGTNYDKTGKYTGVGVFTIIAEADGEGAAKWGKLKSGAGWISLDYAKSI